MASAAQTLARALDRAALLYSQSYDKQASDAAMEELKTNPLKPVDFGRFHMKTLHQCCMESNSDLAEPVYFLLKWTWNDALDWSKTVK